MGPRPPGPRRPGGRPGVHGRPTGRSRRPTTLPGIAEAADRLAARSARASGSRCTATTTATASAPRPSWCAPCARAAPTSVPFLPSRFTDGYGVADATVDLLAERGARVLVVRRLRHVGDRRRSRARSTSGWTPSCSTTTSRAGTGRRGSWPTRRWAGPPTTCRPPPAWCTWSCARWPTAWTAARSSSTPTRASTWSLSRPWPTPCPLLGDNRRRVAQGLRSMRESPRPGIAALCAAAEFEPRARHRPLARVHAGPGDQRRRPAGAPGACPRAAAGRPTARRPTRSAPSCGSSTRSAARWSGRSSSRRSPSSRPSRTRSATRGIVVSAGDGWHEGVVGHRRVAAGRALRAAGDRDLAPGRHGEGLGPEPAGRRPARAGGRGRRRRSRAGAGTPARWAWSCRPTGSPGSATT